MSEPIIMLSDRDWSSEPRGWHDVVRCLFGRHKAITKACVDITLVSRCSCGAIRLGFGLWVDTFGRRRRADERRMAETERKMAEIERRIMEEYSIQPDPEP